MIGDFLKRLLQPEPEPLAPMDAQLALTALLVRLARADGYYAADEIIRIEKIAMARFNLAKDEARVLREEAERVEADAPDTVRFTKAIKDTVAYDDRTGVIEALWSVALSDGDRDHHEDALVRLVSSLLGVSDMDSALARKRANGQG
ncbi:MAG: TerB family tellurite resistance protein [Roseovarius sp.]